MHPFSLPAIARGAAALAVLTLGIGAAGAAHAQCPASSLNSEGSITPSTLAAVSLDCGEGGVTGYTVPGGTLDVAIPPFGYSLLPSDLAQVIVADDFTVTG